MIDIRPLSTIADFSEAVTLQQRIWGFADNELLPRRFFVVASRIGGQIFGAYGQQAMVGFCLAVPGMKENLRPYLHSHMLGVLPEWRDAGVGRRLKLRQREEALARGLDLIEWTFDPLEIKNAFFNIERLGAIVRRYAENEYGVTASPLHGGLPTDRCIAEWWIASPRVESSIAGSKARCRVEERIAVPADIAVIRREDANRARVIQRANAARFARCFEQGLAVIGFERNESEAAYLLGPWQ